MRKPADLRAFLTSTVPGLIDHPDLLQIYIDQGKVCCTATPALSFEYRYTLTIFLQAFPGDPDAICVPVLAWLAREQPELFARAGTEPFSFEVEILNAETVDIEIRLPLTERVLVRANDAGGYEVEAIPEPDLTDEFAGVGQAWLWQLFLREELIAETTDPDALDELADD